MVIHPSENTLKEENTRRELLLSTKGVVVVDVCQSNLTYSGSHGRVMKIGKCFRIAIEWWFESASVQNIMAMEFHPSQIWQRECRWFESSTTARVVVSSVGRTSRYKRNFNHHIIQEIGYAGSSFYT